mmetsp:Transcript_23025/g.55499  ORF Transcript_23025/g.55499 Transcript_23025/m.55499 type:complete len:208 (-) Transcript_23025:937-1560(-)
MPNDVVLIRYSISTKHIPRIPCNIQRLAAAVSFNEAHHTRRSLLLFHETSHLKATEPSQRYLCLHVGKLFLDQLVSPQRRTKLLPLQNVIPCTMEAILGSAQRSPRDAVPGIVQAAERALQARDVQLVRGRDSHILHDDHASGAGAQAHLPLDLGRIKARSSPLDEITLDLAIFVACPDNEYVGYGAVGNPIFGTVEHVFLAGGIVI